MVEPLSGDVGQQFRTEPGIDRVAPSTSRPRTAAGQRAAQDALQLRLDQPAQARLGLQRRAPKNLRRHAQRAVTRFFVLLVADLAAFAVMREAIRGVRNAGWLGPDVAGQVQALVPAGYLNGWQFAAALFVGLLVMGNYGPGDRRRNPWRLFLACALGTALPLWMGLWSRGFEPVMVQYGLTVVAVWLGLVAERLTIDGLVARLRPNGNDVVDTLFVGRGDECRQVMASPAFTNGSEFRPLGFVDFNDPPAAGALGHLGDFSLLLAASGAEAVAICGHLTGQQFQEVVDSALAAGCQMLSVPRAAKIAGVHPTTVWRQGQPLVELTAPALKGQQLLVKRVVDLAGALVGLMLTAPLTLVIAAVIKLDSAGPVLFGQERVGLGGRRFRMLKFRTMTNGADAVKESLAHLNRTSDPRLFKIVSDPRVTRIGRWLRRWSLDELPQLWNVLIGDMSLVGPRPFFERDLAHYEAHHFGRLGAKPGITGLWQVSGRSEIVKFDEVVALDTRYIREWSLPLDLTILLKTVPAVLRRRGAI